MELIIRRTTLTILTIFNILNSEFLFNQKVLAGEYETIEEPVTLSVVLDEVETVEDGYIVLYGQKVKIDKKYPKYLPSRLGGVNQLHAPSCYADAMVTAVEHRINEILGRNVLVSKNHMYYAISLAKHLKNKKILNQRFDLNNFEQSIVEIINNYKLIVPNVLNPEDNRLVDENKIGDKVPLLTSMGGYEFVNPPNKESVYADLLEKNFRIDEKPVLKLRKWVKESEALIVVVPSALFNTHPNYFDHISGVPNTNNLPLSKMDHAVAILGFDDELKSFIVRNSWNDKDALNESFNHNSSGPFKIKMGIYSLPGYYLIPYDYIDKIVENNHSEGLETLRVRFDSYQILQWNNELEKKLFTYLALYSCHSSKEVYKKLDFLQRKLNTTNSLKEEIKSIFGYNSSSISILNFAKFSVSRLANPNSQNYMNYLKSVIEFYKNKNGVLNNYYCKDSKANNIWPSYESVNDKWFFDSGLYLKLGFYLSYQTDAMNEKAIRILLKEYEKYKSSIKGY